MTTKLEELSARLGSMQNEVVETPCPYARMVTKFLEDDNEVGELLSEVIYDNQLSLRRIHVEVKRYGYKIGIESLALHRKGICTCPPREGN